MDLRVLRYFLTVAKEQSFKMCIRDRHVEYPIYGVQFHPESIMTPDGKAMIKNFLEH